MIRSQTIRRNNINDWPNSVMEVIGLLVTQGYARLPDWTAHLPDDENLQPYVTDGLSTIYFKTHEELVEHLQTLYRLPLKGPQPGVNHDRNHRYR